VLRALADERWVAEMPLRFWGVEIGARTTVVRLAGGFWVHSPIRLAALGRDALDALGKVRWIVAPNTHHHLFLTEWAAAYPGARLYAAPGLARKRSELRFHEELADDPPAEWAGAFDQHVFRGAPLFREAAFFHRATRTLILADLAFHIGPSSAPLTRALARAVGLYRKLGWSWVERGWLVNDRAAARESVARILSWNFERVIVAHGEVLEHGGREAFRAGWAWP
jgi:hypothetical protein